ncbi:MAG: InlB B-repeat-containing protein [Anaerovoracaceae bacterium]
MKKLLKHGLVVIMSIVLILTMMPFVPGGKAHAGTYTYLGDVDSVEATLTVNIPAQAGDPCNRPSQVAIASPTDKGVSLEMVAWQKKNADGSWGDYYSSTFEVGTYRLRGQLRTEKLSDYTYYKLTDNATLTVNGQNWSGDGVFYDYYESNGYGYRLYNSSEITLSAPPETQTVTVQSNDPRYGTASANPVAAQEGTIVTLTATPRAGYRLKEWSVVSGGVTITDNSFVMGTSDVSIQAVFEPIPRTCKGDVDSVTATLTVNTPTQAGDVCDRPGQVTITSPTDKGVSLIMASWQKKSADGIWKYYYSSTFDAGTYRLVGQLRTEQFSDYTYYKLTNNTTLTVNGQSWSSDGNLMDYYYESNGYGFRQYKSPEYTVTAPIRYMDMGNIQHSVLSPVTGILCTPALDRDGTLYEQMDFKDWYWQDAADASLKIHMGEVTKPTVGHTYQFVAVMEPKEYYFFDNNPFDQFIFEGNVLPANGYTKTLNADGTVTLSGFLQKTAAPDSISSVTLSASAYTYNGTAKTPTVTVKDAENTTLVKDTDYTVSYQAGRINAGTYKVTVTGKGNYTGTIVETFTIKPAALTSAALSTTSYTYNGKVKTPGVTVKDAGGKTLVKNSDYTVTYASGRKVIGTYKVTIKGRGNYAGTITKTFRIIPAKVSILTPKVGKRYVTVKWKKASGNVRYQVGYRRKGAKSGKYLTSGATYKTIKNLKSGKYYYVKVRAYKKVGTKTYFGAWSATKRVKIR